MQNSLYKEQLDEYVKKVIENYPFYQWFYKNIESNKVNYSNLPVMTKLDLIKYKLETNKEFYADTKNTQFDNFYSTTGTSGLLLEFPYFKGKLGSLINFAEEFTCFNNEIFFDNIGTFQIYPKDINYLLIELCSILSNKEPIILEADKSNTLIDAFNKNKIDTLLDPTSEFSISLVKDKITSDMTSLSNIIVLYIDRVNLKKLRELGFNIVSIFACMEFGFLGFKITYESPKYIFCSDCYLDLCLSEQMNSMVLTGSFGEFPLIKYCIDDNISLEVNKGILYFKHEGRKLSIGIPDNAQGNFHYATVEDELRGIDGLYIKNFLMVAYRITRDNSPKNIIATFVAIEGNTQKLTIQKSIMELGFGEHNIGYEYYFPVYIVDDGLIPNLGRNKHFLNFTEGRNERWDCCLNLTKLVSQDYKIEH